MRACRSPAGPRSRYRAARSCGATTRLRRRRGAAASCPVRYRRRPAPTAHRPRFSNVRSAQALQRVLAGALAALAGLAADTAMFVMVGVARTFLGAGPAGDLARADHAAQHLAVGAGAPCRKRPGQRAKVCAVETDADALPQLLDHLLAEAGVGAGCAGLGTVVAGFDAADQRGVRLAIGVRVRLDHLLGVHGALHRRSAGRTGLTGLARLAFRDDGLERSGRRALGGGLEPDIEGRGLADGLIDDAVALGQLLQDRELLGTGVGIEVEAEADGLEAD